MREYDVRTVDGVDFIYIGNDVNGNCKYAVNYRQFLRVYELSLPFEKRLEIARERAKAAFFDREKKGVEPYFVVRPGGNFANIVRRIRQELEE